MGSPRQSPGKDKEIHTFNPTEGAKGQAEPRAFFADLGECMSPHPGSGPGLEEAPGTQVWELRWPHPRGTRHGAQPGFLQLCSLAPSGLTLCWPCLNVPLSPLLKQKGLEPTLFRQPHLPTDRSISPKSQKTGIQVYCVVMHPHITGLAVRCVYLCTNQK